MKPEDFATGNSHHQLPDSESGKQSHGILTRKISLEGKSGEDLWNLLHQEWLVSNGLGGYASGTIGGEVTRRYHGYLIAALPAPLGRVVMLNHLDETITLNDGRCFRLGVENEFNPLIEFRLEYHMPVWMYRFDDLILEKRVLLIHGQNTVHINYRVISEHQSAMIELRPSLQFRTHESDVGVPALEDYTLTIQEWRYEVWASKKYPPLRLMVFGDTTGFAHQGGEAREVYYPREAERGYHSHAQLWTPGCFSGRVGLNHDFTLIASTEAWSTAAAIEPARARELEIERRRHLLSVANHHAEDHTTAELALAADQFIINPTGRIEDGVRARAAGDEERTIIAGYHWFTDWGRDTMISLEGLTLTTGRHEEAGWILRTFAHYIHKGLIPNLFPEGKKEGLYHTSDATLWYFHALDRYVETTRDQRTLAKVFPKLKHIIECHERGTLFNIRVDPEDGLLTQGAEGYQLTWMDAKVGDWVVTPRRGKAVEINALWYNALRLMENWLRGMGADEESRSYGEKAHRVRGSFNKRFWNPETNYLFDVVDGDKGNDPACRPNQIFSISLPHPILDEVYWHSVMEVVQTRLLTPKGLRSLSPEHGDYKSYYFGDLRARDAAYHQGTVWAWLIGPFIDAWLRLHPDERREARGFLLGLVENLNDGCIGSINEIFDAEAPYMSRGCIAQAWSVAELLRCWVKTD